MQLTSYWTVWVGFSQVEGGPGGRSADGAASTDATSFACEAAILGLGLKGFGTVPVQDVVGNAGFGFFVFGDPGFELLKIKDKRVVVPVAKGVTHTTSGSVELSSSWDSSDVVVVSGGVVELSGQVPSGNISFYTNP